MKSHAYVLFLTVMALISTTSFAVTSAEPSEDPGGSRLIEAAGKELIVYQPQVDSWADDKILHFRCAISVKTGKGNQEKFGVAEIEADTVVDHGNRIVALLPRLRLLRFPNASDAEADALRKTVDELYPQGRALSLSLDRVVAYLDPAKQAQQHAVELNLDPPKVFYSSKPSILVIFIGEAQLQPVVKDRNDLMFAVNSNWPVFFDTADQRYYLLNADTWLITADVLKGPWNALETLPKSLASLPPDENWQDVREQIPGTRPSTLPTIFVSTEPGDIVQSSTPTTVVCSQTAGYSGDYLVATGVLMFDVGMGGRGRRLGYQTWTGCCSQRQTG